MQNQTIGVTARAAWQTVSRQKYSQLAPKEQDKAVQHADTGAQSKPKLIGLEAFFEDGHALPPVPTGTELPPSYGRAWHADELRLKSFADLHGLWYVLLREINMLATQRAEAKRSGLRWPFRSRLFKCRLSMARIKTVLTERHSLYLRAKTAANIGPARSDLSSADDAGTVPEKTEAELLTEWHRSEKMRQLWRKRKFRRRMNYRLNRSSLFV